MSGIAGILRRDGRPVQQSEVQGMLSAISFRGPDGQGIWTNGSVGLGHCILRTTPESDYEIQPFINQREDLIITADARIDNRNELITLLNLNSHQPLLLSDSELILTAYEKWGEHCAKKLLGDFSFAIWDKRNQRLYCAIDHFRIKPFCYFNNRDCFIFSSQISGLLPGKLVPKEINKIRLGSLFINELADIDKTTCIYKNIFYLPAASYLMVDNDSMIIREYWNINEIKELKRGSDTEYKEEFMAILQEAVRCRLRSRDITAIAMSGGIDSTTIAALANNLLKTSGNRHISISGLAGNEQTSIESTYIRKATSSLSANPVFIMPETIKSLLDDLVTSMKRLDTPRLYQEIFLLTLFTTTRLNQARILLDGEEGDTVLGLGIHYISHLLKNRKISTAIRESYLRAKNTINYPYAIFEVLIKSIRAAWFPNFIRPYTYAVKSQFIYKRMIKESMINPLFADQLDLKAKLARIQEQAGFGITGSINQMRLRTFNQPFISLIPISLDMMSSACSTELRHPYLDKRLVEYSYGLPWDQKNRDGWEKYILRQATENLVPDDIRWRKEIDHVGWEYNTAFLHIIYPELKSIIDDKSNAVFEYFDYPAMQEIFKRYDNANGDIDGSHLIKLYGLNSWLNSKYKLP